MTPNKVASSTPSDETPPCDQLDIPPASPVSAMSSSPSMPTSNPPATPVEEVGSGGPDGPSFLKVDISEIGLTPQDLYDPEKLDIWKIPMEELWRVLRCDKNGLDSEESQRRRGIFGLQITFKKKPSQILEFLSIMWDPCFWAMEITALGSIVLCNGGHLPPDWQVFIGIIVLLLGYASFTYFHQRNATSAAGALFDSRVPKAKCCREGNWVDTALDELVPGDIVSLKKGDIIPADCRIFDSLDLWVNQAESDGIPNWLPAHVEDGDHCYLDSKCCSGESYGLVIATGPHTVHQQHLNHDRVETSSNSESSGSSSQSLSGSGSATRSSPQNNPRQSPPGSDLVYVLNSTSVCVLITTGVFVVLEIIILYAHYHQSYRRGLDNILVLLIGGLPFATSTFVASSLAAGFAKLVKDHAVVAHRVKSVVDLAGIDVFCFDKDGTLTITEMEVDESSIKTYGGYSVNQLMRLIVSVYSLDPNPPVPLSSRRSFVNSLKDPADNQRGITKINFKKFDFRYSQTTYIEDATGVTKRVALGAPDRVLQLCRPLISIQEGKQIEHDIECSILSGCGTFATTYSVAVEDVLSGDGNAEGTGFQFVGLVTTRDPFRVDSKETLHALKALGIRVMILTGHAVQRAREAGKFLGIGENIYNDSVLTIGNPVEGSCNSVDQILQTASGFSTSNKAPIIQALQDLGREVAMIGDGSNDVSAIDRANVGFAVNGAIQSVIDVSSMKLLDQGLYSLVHAIQQSRAIFERLRSYATYTCAVTIRITLTFGFLAFAFQFDFPPFMMVVIILLSGPMIMTLVTDRVSASKTPVRWDLKEIIIQAIAYGFYQALSTISFYLVVVHTNFFHNKFGVLSITQAGDPTLRMLIFLQVAQTTHALIFATRTQSWSFTLRPSIPLALVTVAQLGISSIIAAFANWGFAKVLAIPSGYIGIVWIWNLIWCLPLDLVKFGSSWLAKQIPQPKVGSFKRIFQGQRRD